jgi:hypothetical protein
MSSKDYNNSGKDENKDDILNRDDVKNSISYGVTPDDLDYKKLFGLTFVGIILVVVLVIFAKVLFDYYAFTSSQEAAKNAVFYDIEELRARDNKLLSTFEVIDSEKGVFRVPVDSAITLVLEDYK